MEVDMEVVTVPIYISDDEVHSDEILKYDLI